MTLINGRAYKKSELLNEGTPVLRIQNLNGGNNWYYSDLMLPEDKYCEKDDLLYAWSATFGPYRYLGEKAIYHYHIWKILPHRSVINKAYAFYALMNITDNVKNKAHGISMLHITKGGMEDMDVYCPPLPEQKKIAAILDAADAYRQKTKALIEKYDALTQSLFLDMFGDPVTNPKGWEKVPTIRHCDCIVPGRNKPKSFTGNIPWITTADLNHLGYTYQSKSSIGLTQSEITEVRARIIPQKSVLMTCVGDLGLTSVNSNDVVMNQQLHAFICHEELNNVFLMYNLSFQTPYMLKMASSTTVPYMNKTIANNTPTIVPPLPLQNQFAEHVQKIEAQKAKAQASLEKAEALFNSLLQRAFKRELTS